MYEYFLLTYLGVEHQNIARYKNGVFERYHLKKNVWYDEPEMFGIFSGEYEADCITEEQATKIIAEMVVTN